MKKRNKLSLLGLIIILVLGPLAYFRFIKPKLTKAAWYATSGWYYRKALTIDYTKVSGGANLDSFPVLVSLTDGGLRTNAQESGNDIMFTSSDGTTKLDHEIEKYTSSTGTLIAWVRIPTLSYTTDTVIYMYYGNPGASDQSNKAAVWDADYVGVWHLAETSGHHIDSKGLQADSTAEGEISRTASGKANGAVLYNATGGAISIPTSTDLNLTTDLTVEAWIRVDGPALPGNSRTVMQKCSEAGCSTSPYKTYEMDLTIGDAVCFYLTTSGDSTSNCTDALTIGNWYYITASAQVSTDITNAKIYQNGLQIGGTASAAGATITSTKDLFFGDSGWGDPFNGIIDEVRFSKAARTDGWIVTTYNTINSPSTFFSKGTEEKSKDPVAYWSFNEGFGTTANDSTSNRNDGTLGTGASAPSWQTEDLCVSGKCLFFNGNNNFVDATSNVFSTLITAETDFTVSAWVKPVSFTNDGTVIGQRYGDSMVFGTRTTGKLFLNMDDTRESSPESSNALSLNSWQYVVATFKGTDSSHTVNFYINGKLSGSGTADDGEAGIDAQTNMFIGYESRFLKSFDGFIDEAKIYPYVRTAAEVKADYNAGKAHASSIKGSSTSLGNNNKNSEAFSEGLVGYWKMEENTGTTVADSSRNGNIATLGTGTSAPTWSAGRFGIGTSFDGTSDYIQISDSTSLDSISDNNQITVSLWIKPNRDYTAEASDWYYFTSRDGATRQPFQFGYSGWNDTVAFSIGGSNSYNSSCKEPDNTYLYNGIWYHYVGVYDGKNIILYKNGQQVAISPFTENIDTGGDAFIGGLPAQRWFTGVFDEVRIYNRALSPAEVQQLYNWAPGPVAYYNFNEGVGSSVYDSSGNNLTMTKYGSASWQRGKYSASIYTTSNSADYLQTGDNDYLDMSNQLTVEAWIKRDGNTGAWNTILEKGKSAEGINYWFGFSTSNYLGLSLNPIAGDDAERYYVYSPNTITDKNWHHVAGTYDKSKVKIYIDGVLYTTENHSDILYTGTGEFTIGYSKRWGCCGFKGNIDEARVYNYARTQKQIVEDMNAGHPAGGGPVGSQVAKYSFDEGYGTTLRNDISGGVSLSLGTGASAPSWSLDGKYGKALSFDGGGDFAYTANTALMTGAGQTYPSVSFSAWVNPTSSAVSKTILHKNSEFRMTTDANSKLNCSIYAGGSWQTGASSASALTLNSWQHVLCNYDGANIKVWINGVNKGSQAETDQLSSFSSTALYIARDSTTAAGTFQGLIDDIKIYNYSLSEEEIKIDYNRGSAMVLGSLSSGTGNTASVNAQSQTFCIPGDTTSCAPPVAYWNFNEGNGTTLYDRSGNGLDTTAFVGSPLWTTGKFGKALSFDGSDDYAYVNANSALNFTGTNNFSFSVWAKPSLTGGGANPRIFHKERWVSSSDCGGYMLAIPNSGYAQFVIKNNNNGVGPTTLVVANQWVHLAGLYNGSTMYFYKNGILAGTAPNTTGPGTHPAAPFEIAGTSVFKGLVDELRIYNYARTPAQIAWDYNRGAPVAWWDFDECQGGTAHNRQPSTSNLDGTITIGASGTQNTAGTCALGVGQSSAWANGATGKYNASLNFDGTDDYASLTSAINFSTATSWTVAGWFKRTGTASSIESLVNNCYNNNCFGLSLMGSTLTWETGSADWNRVIGYTLPTTWTFVAAIFSGSSGNWSVNWYKDGVSQSTTSSTYLFNTPSINYFGGPGTGGGASINMDDVRIYNYALTATQIKILYNEGGAVRFGPSEGNP